MSKKQIVNCPEADISQDLIPVVKSKREKNTENSFRGDTISSNRGRRKSGANRHRRILSHQSKLPSISTKDDPPAAASLDSDIEGSLQEEISVLVLLRLPAMELVCHKKLWHIISSPSFVSAHLKHFKSDPSSHYLLARDSMLIKPKGLPPAPLDSIVSCTSEYMAIVGSVNGLICLAGISRRCPTPDEIFILNPVTRLSRKLPSRSKYRITPDTRSVKLAFWWDDDSDLSTGGRGVYKVAKIVTIPHVKCMLEIWESSVPHKWTELRALEFNFNDIPAFSLAHPCDVLIEGDAAYWIVRNYEGNFSVLSLDLKSLGVKFIPLSEQQMITQSELYAWRAAGGLNIHMFGASCNGSFVLLRNRFSGNRRCRGKVVRIGSSVKCQSTWIFVS